MSLVNETLGSETETRPRRLIFFRDQDRDRDLSKFSETETRPRPLKKGLETVSRPRRQDRDYIPALLTTNAISKFTSLALVPLLNLLY